MPATAPSASATAWAAEPGDKIGPLPLTTLDDRRISPNLNFGRPANNTGISAYQAPISARFGVALSF